MPRQRLIARLQAGLSRKLTLISAPAGFGKTTLLCEWLNQNQLPSAWVSLDEGDNDPGRFLAYVTAALYYTHDVTESGVQGPATPLIHDPPIELLLTALINDFAATPAAQDAPPRLLVLDDYHFIHSQAVHQAMAYLLEHMPRHMHLIITSRTDPPLPLPRLRARAAVELSVRNALQALHLSLQTYSAILPVQSSAMLSVLLKNNPLNCC